MTSIDYITSVPRNVWLVLIAIALLVIASRSSIWGLWTGIGAAYARSGFVYVIGDLLVYLLLLGVIAWAAVQICFNLMDNYIGGRPVTLIAPVQVSAPDPAGADGMKLAQILSANLSAIATSAERSLPSEKEFNDFKASQAYTLLPKRTDGGKDGLDTIFSTTRIGNAPVADALNLDATTKFEVSGTDFTPYVDWLIKRFRRHNSVQLTILDLKPGRKLIWNLDTARTAWNSETLSNAITTDEVALEEFTWRYAHTLAARSQKATAFNTISAEQYHTIVRSYALYADAIRAAGLRPDLDMRLAFSRILAFLETGIDPGPPPSDALPGAWPPVPATGEVSGGSVSLCAPVKEVAGRWWELSKSFAVIASLAGKQDVARAYAQLALALLKDVTIERPDDAVIAALGAFASTATTPKSAPSAAEANRSSVIFLTKKPLDPVSHPGQIIDNENDPVRGSRFDTIELFESKQPIDGPVSALETVQLSGFPSKARLVLDLPLDILNSPALPKLIREDLDPSTIVIYTRADVQAAEHLRQAYQATAVHPEGTLTAEAIREAETRAAN